MKNPSGVASGPNWTAVIRVDPVSDADFVVCLDLV